MEAATGDNDHSFKSALDESAEELYEMAPCGYLTTAVDGRILKVNRTLTEWVGYEREELLDGKRIMDLLTVGGKIFYETHFNLLLRMQTSVDEIALDIICKSGNILPVLLNARQKRDAAGQPILNRFTIFNATERRTYERDLLAARDLFRTTLASIGDAVIATGAEARVTFINSVAEELSGWKHETALGRHINEVITLVREDSGAKIENPITHALRTGAIVGLENHTILISKDGRHIPVDDSASPVRDANGSILGGVLVFRDISQRRAAEKTLSEAHRRLTERAAELARSNEDLSQFAHVASHDLRSPLRTIIQLSQLLQRNHEEKLGDDGRKLVNYVVGAGQRMADLIEDLLSYARASADDNDAASPVDANRQLELALENLTAVITESGAIITHDALPVISINATSLVQIFQNLIANAIRYRRQEAPLIHVAAQDQGTVWQFSCKDNGLGVPPEYQKLIFEPFKRLHGTERPGSGIGLAVCKRIIERYRGKIWVESQVNDEGSTFFFTIPKSSDVEA